MVITTTLPRALPPPLVFLDHKLIRYKYNLTVATTSLLSVDLLRLHLQLPGHQGLSTGQPGCSYGTEITNLLVSC